MASRPQMQERMTEDIVEYIDIELDPRRAGHGLDPVKSGCRASSSATRSRSCSTGSCTMHSCPYGQVSLLQTMQWRSRLDTTAPRGP
jgi:hypothetical protein